MSKVRRTEVAPQTHHSPPHSPQTTAASPSVQSHTSNHINASMDDTHAARQGINRSDTRKAQLSASVRTASSTPTYNGSRPAPGTTDTNAARPLNPPVTNNPAHRSAAAYSNVVNQFAVGNNPRYAHRDGNTYCNIFIWDVTRAMGAEVPHWVNNNGTPMKYGQGHELDANDTNTWLRQHGAEHGWRKVSAAEAQKLANVGHPAIASWNNPGGIGHIAIVRPGSINSNGPEIAQAGSRNLNDTHVRETFGNRPVEYFVNDRGYAGHGNTPGHHPPATHPNPPAAPPKTPPKTPPKSPSTSPHTPSAHPYTSGVTKVPAHDLTRGNRSPEVKELQSELVHLGYLKQSDMNTGPGIFGAHTFAAVKEFQRTHGVPDTGYYGPLSRAALSRTLNTAPPDNLQRGDHGAEVRQLQAQLVKLGDMKQSEMNTGPGIFGPLTKAAVQKFQQAHNVPHTGFYGPLTRVALTKALGGGNVHAAPPPPSSNAPTPPRPSNPHPVSPTPTTHPTSPAPPSPGGKSVADPTGILSRTHPAGASSGTAKSEGLPGGYKSSQTIAARDRQRVLESHDLKHKFEQVGKEYGIPPALLAGIASRETHGGNALDANGNGKYDPNGYGVLQVDINNGHQAKEGGPYGLGHLKQAAGIFKAKLDKVKQQHPKLPLEQQLQMAVSRYNGGRGLSYPNSDTGTTGGDYANDTLARAQYYAAHWNR